MLHRAIDNAAPQADAEETRKLVLKLRWFGLEEEAASLQSLLQPDQIALGPLDTD